MSRPTDKFILFLCAMVSASPVTTIAADSYDTAAVMAAYNSVIRECNNLASKSDLKFAGEISKKPWTEKQKAELLAITHNGFLQVCLRGVAADIMKYAERIDIKTSD